MDCAFQRCITIGMSKRTNMLEVELLLPIPACLFGGLHAVAWQKCSQEGYGPSLKLTWLRDLDLFPTLLFPFTLVCFRCCFLAWYITIETTMWGVFVNIFFNHLAKWWNLGTIPINSKWWEFDTNLKLKANQKDHGGRYIPSYYTACTCSLGSDFSKWP